MAILKDSVAARAQAGRPRGPMRPRKLVSVRSRREHGLAVYAFRAVDLLALIALAAYAVHQCAPHRLWATPVVDTLPVVIAALVLARLLRTVGAYNFRAIRGIVDHLLRVVVAAIVSFVVTVLVVLVAASVGATWTVPTLTTRWMVPATACLLVLHTAWWITARRLLAAGWLTPNLVIVGATDYAEELIRDALARRHVNIVGIFDDRRERRPASLCGVPVLGGVDDLVEHKIMPFVDRIVVAIQPEPTERALNLATRLSVLPNDITFFTAASGSSVRGLAVERLGDRPVGRGGLTGTGHRSELEQRALIKRVQDLLLAVPLLVLATPVLLVVALVVKLDSRGPVFFRQHRHGFANEDILVWKFRSMHHIADGVRDERQVTTNDPRVTRVGALLRRTSLDELPQLLNVIGGQMSLVGPRPHAIGMTTGDSYAAHLVDQYAHRHRIKPGITGWAAINGSRGPVHTLEEVRARVALDIEYIERHSFALDLSIILKTLPTMLGDRAVIR